MRVRDFNVLDWRSVMKIERCCFPRTKTWVPWSRYDYERLIKDQGGYALVLGEPVIGVCWILGDEIVSLGVLKEYRGHGYARMLLRTALARIQKDFSSANLHVRPENIGAQRLYLDHGFLPDSFDYDYYAPGEGGIVMVKEFVRL